MKETKIKDKPLLRVRIRENSRLARLGAMKLKSKSVALTWGSSIHLYGVSRTDFLQDSCWVCHELVHVFQYRRYGKWRFTWQYLWESLRKGYFHNRWEVEAREKEKDISLLQHVYFT